MLTNSQYQQLMSKYYERQLKTKDLMEQRYQEVTTAIPDLPELDKESETRVYLSGLSGHRIYRWEKVFLSGKGNRKLLIFPIQFKRYSGL